MSDNTADLVALLREARDLLWHNGNHGLVGPTCPGCELEAKIDAALNDGNHS